jgi:hypothetical protein
MAFVAANVVSQFTQLSLTHFACSRHRRQQSHALPRAFPAAGPHTPKGWNVLDAAVVLLGLLEQVGLGNFTALRAVRVLRPLRAVTKIRGLRVSALAFAAAARLVTYDVTSCRAASMACGCVR